MSLIKYGQNINKITKIRKCIFKEITPISLINKAEEVGKMEMVAALFWHLSSTIHLIPYHPFLPSFMISSWIFLAFYTNSGKKLVKLYKN